MKVVGYITSDPLHEQYIPFGMQNRIIKEFVEGQGKTFMLSWTEARQMAPWMLDSLLQENFYQGICFYSLDQLLSIPQADDYLARLSTLNIWIGFALEKLSFRGNENLMEVVSLLHLKKLSSFPRKDLPHLWNVLSSHDFS